MMRKFSKEFMTVIGELLALCVAHDTDTIDIGFISKSGIMWNVKMIFSTPDERGTDD